LPSATGTASALRLAAHKARARHTALDAHVFGTTRGRRQGETNIRPRVLARAVAEANDALEQARRAPLPDRLTPHSLRRTYASLLFAVGRTAPEVMDQLGHTDPKLTLRIYARAMRREPGESEALRGLVDGGRLEAAGAPVGGGVFLPVADRG
jgi:integrase